MRHIPLTVPLMAGALLLMLAAGAAQAQTGMLMEPDALPPTLRAQLEGDILTARAIDPESFAHVSTLVAWANELDQSRRGRFFPFSRMFRNMGDQGTLPLIELLAFQGPTRGELRPEAWDSLRASALQALGEIGDPRARPVIEAFLRGPETNAHVVRNGAAALGWYGDDAAAATLIELASEPGPKREAIIAGIGECRRLAVAAFLADELRTRPTGEHAARTMDALADVGNAWAWQTSRVLRHAREELAIRGLAMEALLEALVTYDGHLRIEARKALFVVHHPDTVARLQALRAQHASNPELARDLDIALRNHLERPAL